MTDRRHYSISFKLNICLVIPENKQHENSSLLEAQFETSLVQTLAKSEDSSEKQSDRCAFELGNWLGTR